VDLSQVLPPGGLGAVGAGSLLAIVILYLLNSNRADRKDYQDAIDKAELRADQAEARRREAETRIEDLQRQLDEARSARRAAEDRAGRCPSGGS